MAIEFNDPELNDVWYHVPAIEFLEPEDKERAAFLFGDAMEQARDMRIRPQDTDQFQNFLDFMGLSLRDFPWEDFRQWFGETA